MGADNLSAENKLFLQKFSINNFSKTIAFAANSLSTEITLFSNNFSGVSVNCVYYKTT